MIPLNAYQETILYKDDVFKIIKLHCISFLFYLSIHLSMYLFFSFPEGFQRLMKTRRTKQS